MNISPSLARVGDDIVSAYLVVEDGAATLVDAALPGYRRDLRRVLTSLGLTERDIRGIVLTHGDVDHIGFAEALRAEHGIPVFVHAADVDRAQGREKPPKTAMPAWRIGSALRFLWTALRKTGRTRPLREVSPVNDGDTLDLPGAPHIIGMPGHSPGSIAVHFPSVSAVCVGDALTTRHVLTGEERVQDAPFSDDVAAARASIERLRTLDATWVLPGHGVIWSRGATALADEFAADPQPKTS